MMKLSTSVLSTIMVSVIMLSVAMLNVVVPGTNTPAYYGTELMTALKVL
jgi:hypothetical protein